MTVAVIVPSYRRPNSLIPCLRGIIDGARTPDEIVVVLRDIDTESHNALDQWLNEGHAQRAGVSVRLAIAERPGQIVAMNCGLAATNADIVCFTDDDCVPRSHWLERIVAHYQDPAVGGVGGRDVVHVDGEIIGHEVDTVGRIAWFGRLTGNHHMQYNGGPVEVDHLKGANMSFRRPLMKPFDENMSGGSSCLNDTDASLHVRAQGYTLVYDPAAIVDHYAAERFGASTRVVSHPDLIYSDSHNWVYCLFKYLGGAQRWVFLLYALLIGAGRRYGLIKWLFAVPRRPKTATSLLWASTRGKLAGLRAYYKARRKEGLEHNAHRNHR